MKGIMNGFHLLISMSIIARFLFLFFCFSFSQDTFSIVAVDPETNEVGSAGASCIAGSVIISDIHPGVGAIHTQSYWLAANQANASELMSLGASPDEIIDYLINNDIQNNPSIRQYGVIDLVNGGRSAAFTGDGCFDYKNHILGDTYSIQGNILLGQDILDQMEIGFLNTEGTLSDKLMAALQGANVPGADTRCLDDGISSLSAFIRVANPDDNSNFPNLNINVNNVNFAGYLIDPIDSVQTLYDMWLYEQVLPGDVNQDLNIDVLDVVAIINFILGVSNPSPIEFMSSDLNQDGIINIQDIIQIINIIISEN